MNLLFIGDIVGKGGREAVRELVPQLRREFNCQFVIANGENAAAGNGLTGRCAAELGQTVEVITTGDHVWDQKGFDVEIKTINNIVRPANLSKKQPGVGFGVWRNAAAGEIAVIALLGKVFMKESAYCPFETVETILNQLPGQVKTVVVDFHAEATSEKLAMGRFLDGKVTAVIGTHTHVQTNDAVILPGQTAYLSDVGMVGAEESILGRSIEDVIKKFTTGMPNRLSVVESGKIRLDAAVVSYDHMTGRASGIQILHRYIEIA